MRIPILLLLLVGFQDKPADLAKKEKEALATISTEMLRLARFCIQEKSYADARNALAKGLELAPDSKPLQDEKKKIPAKDATPKAGYQKKFADEKRKSDEKCADLLADFAAKCGQAGATEKFEKALWTIQKHFPSSKKAFDKAGAVLFEPYLKWVSKVDLAKLESGMEFLDGKWLDVAAIDKANKKHATWDDPWVQSDDIHQLTTTLPLRQARQVLAHIAAFRGFVLQKFAGLWDLQPPAGKLPVILTETYDEMFAQFRKLPGAADREMPPFQGAAFYLQTNGTLSPCFVTLELRDPSGKTLKVALDKVLMTLRHEITHQIAFEYSKHEFDNSRGVEHQFWSVEAIANYMMSYVFDKGEWRISKPKMIDMGVGFIEADYAWCVAHREEMQPLDKLFGLTHEQFMTAENYHMSAAVAHFLIDGEEGRYRAGFIKLLEIIHRVRDTAKTFDDCFEGVDRKALQEQWLKFVAAIELE